MSQRCNYRNCLVGFFSLFSFVRTFRAQKVIFLNVNVSNRLHPREILYVMQSTVLESFCSLYPLAHNIRISYNYSRTKACSEKKKIPLFVATVNSTANPKNFKEISVKMQ